MDTADPFAPLELMPDICIDLETMGTKPNAPIIAIGAVAFNLFQMRFGEMFYVNVDLASSVELGFVIDPATVMWWLGQDDDARRNLLRDPRPITSALTELSRFMNDNCVPFNQVNVWGNGPDFDNLILAEHYRAAKQVPPWRYTGNRCYRTVRRLYPNVEMDPAKGTHHNALDDAVYQVEHLFKIRRTLRGNA